jgi:hypothetical protein
VPYFVLWNVIEKCANKHCVKTKPDIGQVRWTKEFRNRTETEGKYSVYVDVSFHNHFLIVVFTIVAMLLL